jgi:hypothetical protein
VSNQRSAEFVRIHRCHFEGTSDQDIDFEPSGATPGTDPRRYSIVGNRFIRRIHAVAVTLSGVAVATSPQDAAGGVSVAFSDNGSGRAGVLFRHRRLRSRASTTCPTR